MFSNPHILYRQTAILDHSKDGGPRCYYEFKYKKNTIILIGECHSELPFVIGKQYEYICRQFIDDNQNIKTRIYVERKPDPQIPSTRRTIINIFANMSNNENVQIINADDRLNDDSHSMLFVILEMLITAFYKKNITFNKDKVNLAWNKLTLLFKEKIIKILTLIDYEEFLKIHLQNLSALIEKHENNKALCRFLTECQEMIKMSFDLFNELKEEYAIISIDENNDHHYLDDVCIKMMNAQNSLKPAIRWYYALSPYFSYALDATLACRLSEDLHSNEVEQTLIVVAGSKHAENLVSYFSSFCELICSIPLRLNTEASIRPDELQNCFKGITSISGGKDENLLVI